LFQTHLLVIHHLNTQAGVWTLQHILPQRPSEEDFHFRWEKAVGADGNLKEQRSCFHPQNSSNKGQWQYSHQCQSLEMDDFPQTFQKNGEHKQIKATQIKTKENNKTNKT